MVPRRSGSGIGVMRSGLGTTQKPEGPGPGSKVWVGHYILGAGPWVQVLSGLAGPGLWLGNPGLIWDLGLVRGGGRPRLAVCPCLLGLH